MKVVLRNTNVGKRSKFETRILQVDDDTGMILVQYSEEAKNLHTQKHFSITPKRPVPVRLMNPSVSSAGTVINGAIFELSRLGMVVFSEDAIPVNQCLSAIFTLPGGGDVSTPLAIARQADGDFMYDVEFVVIDEKERTEIVQYMYKRQIEQSKEKSKI